ncbi:MAG: hypothetical protein RQ733_11455 [Methyloprofundus sp.]|nr:hypothetical protein [Methyloprofundus sp.]MDT8426573.1 hypothetical protein [Methyloprofundus sp.]
MSEVFFILTVIYVAYVVFIVVDDDNIEPKKPANPGAAAFKQPTVPQKPALVTEEKTEEPTPIVKPTKVQPAVEPTKPKINKLAEPKIELRTVVMKNPETGEEAKVATNYRMVKRWVKEALVTEGLLDKVYKNTELDDAAKIKVAKALSIIKAMDKYKP